MRRREEIMDNVQALGTMFTFICVNIYKRKKYALISKEVLRESRFTSLNQEKKKSLREIVSPLP